MTTTFDTRQTARDGLVALFVADDSWAKVFGYYPTATEINREWPLLIINAAGTLQTMPALDMNPSVFTFTATSLVPTEDNVAWETDNASNLTDTLDQTLRQIIRDNAAGAGFATLLSFVETPSNVVVTELHGINYITEIRLIEAKLSTGAAIP